MAGCLTFATQPSQHDPVRQRNPAHQPEEEMRRSYLDYAMSVIVGRACPMHAMA